MKRAELNERFDNLVRARDLKLAWVLLTLFCVLVLATSRMSYWIVGFPSSTWMQHLSRAVIGILIATASLVSVWTTLGEGSLIRRILFLAFAALAIFAAWALGLMAAFYPEPVRLSAREEVYFFGLLPSVFLALCLPLIISRWLFGLVLADQQQDSPTRAPVTTLGLMTVTALIGCCLAGVRLFTLGVQEEVVLMPLGIMCGSSFLIGLFAVLPAVLLLCSRQRNFGIWSPVIILGGNVLIGGTIVGILKATGAWIPLQDVWAIFEGSLVATTTFTIGIGIIRLFGYRVAKQASRKLKT